MEQKTPQDGIYIKITENGPYLVYGNPLIKQEYITQNEDGNSWEYEQGRIFTPPDENKSCIALCRCGHSKHPPFCDKQHIEIKFIGTETASNEPVLENVRVFEGKRYTLLDNEAYCAFARFCDAFGQVWNLVTEGSDQADALALREALYCPAGRLMIKDNETGRLIEPELKKEISVIEDPAAQCGGPLFIKGGIKIESADGQVYEIRNRVTLCRCGQSQNKPFCDGTHASDSLPDKSGL